MRPQNATLLATLLLGACAVDDVAVPDDPEPAETAFGIADTPWGTIEVEYEIRDGLAILDGDIVLGTVEEMEARTDKGRLDSAGRSLVQYRWPNGTVPYVLDPAYTSEQRQVIADAIYAWEDATQYRFRPRNGSDDSWVHFLKSSANDSYVGRRGGQQYIRVVGGSVGLVMHEIGHALGLWHEQARADRDQHVTIHWEDILPGKEHNFQTYVERGRDGRDMFRYDLGSLMHYGSTAFGIDGATTITRKDGTTFEANRTSITDGDASGAMRLLTFTDGQSTYAVKSAATGRCLDVQAASYDRGAPVNNYSCHGGDNQRWYWWYMPYYGKYLVINQRSGMCLDYDRLLAGTRVIQRPCDGWLGQRWTFGNGGLRAGSSNEWCVTARADWTATIERCDGGTDQRWSWGN